MLSEDKDVLRNNIYQYTKHVECRNIVTHNTFSSGNVHLTFDSYFENDTCKDMLIHDCILEANVLPKVCVNIVLSFLPNRFSMWYLPPKLSKDDENEYDIEVITPGPWADDCSLFSQIHIIIDDMTYKFVMDVCMLSASDQSNYITILDDVDFFSMTKHVVSTVEYTYDYDALLKNINNAIAKYNCTVHNLIIFLKIICCIKGGLIMVPMHKKKLKNNGFCIIA